MLLIALVLQVGHILSYSLPFVCKVATPNSILCNKNKYKPLAVGNRSRHATCIGAAWFHDHYLATVNLYGEHIITYHFDEEKKEFTILQQIRNQPNALLEYPEHIAISHDGTILAVCNNHHKAFISLYSIDAQTHLIDPTPFFTLFSHGFLHNVSFSPDDTYLASASFDKKESICVYKLQANSSTKALKLAYKGANVRPDLKLKGVNFTQDGRYVILAYAYAISASPHLESELAIHPFNKDGTIGEIISSVKGNFSFDGVAFFNNDTAIVAPDQAHDSLLIYPFNPETGLIEDNCTIIQNPDAQLSFPHGVAICQNGNYLVVTNLGDDTFNLYHLS